MHHGQVVLLGGLPDRFEVRVIQRDVRAEQGQDRHRPFRGAPPLDFADGLVDRACRGHDHGLETRGELPAEVRRMAVVGPNQPDFELDIGKIDDADPARRDQEVDIGALGVHVLDAALGLIVLHSDSRLPGSSPVGASPGKRLVRAGLSEDAPVELRVHTVLMGVGGASDLRGGDSVGGQIGQARPETGIDVSLQDFRGRVDVRIGIVHAQTTPHGLLRSSAFTVEISGPSTGGDARGEGVSSWASATRGFSLHATPRRLTGPRAPGKVHQPCESGWASRLRRASLSYREV